MMSQDGLSIPSTVKGLPQAQQPNPNPNPNPVKKKRSFPGTPGKFVQYQVITIINCYKCIFLMGFC